MFELTKKDMQMYIRKRIDSITSPVAYSYGYETKESAYEKLLELHTLSLNFGIGMEEEIEKAMEPYKAFFKQLYDESRRKFAR